MTITLNHTIIPAAPALLGLFGVVAELGGPEDQARPEELPPAFTIVNVVRYHDWCSGR